MAILGPTTHGNIKATMPAPNLSSGSPKNASSAAIVMSQASASSHAPARHGPRTVAIVGSGKCQKRMMVSKSLRRIARQDSTPDGTAFHLLLEIETRRECRAGAGDDQRAQAGIAFDLVKRAADLAEHGRIERVGALGPGQGEARDRTDFFDRNREKTSGHGKRPSPRDGHGHCIPAWLQRTSNSCWQAAQRRLDGRLNGVKVKLKGRVGMSQSGHGGRP